MEIPLKNSLEDPNILSRLQPKEYYKKWMIQNYPIRPDQRDVLQFRKLSLQKGTVDSAEASSTVRLGETIVVCGAKLEVSEPSISNPNAGFISKPLVPI